MSIQEMCWNGSQLKPIPGAERAFEVPSAVPPSLARAYLRARMRSPLSQTVEVSVVLDRDTAVAHGSPTDWPSGMTQRVIAGELTLGTLRIQRIGFKANESALNGRGRAMSEPGWPASALRLGKLKVGVSTDFGGCSYMEDEHTVHAPSGADFAMYCCYDGHGGGYASHFCRERLHFNVMGAPAFHHGDARAALLSGFHKSEADLLAEQREAFRRGGLPTGDSSGGGVVSDCCGCTALVLVVLHDSLHVAWAGDCRAALSRAGVAVPLTRDHTTLSPAEAARVLAVGGEISDNRLGGFLEVTRALGDLDAATGSKPGGLSGEPELRSEAVHEDDEFVVLGSDGLWNVISTEDVVRIAREELQAYNDATMASEKLVEVALKRHTDDNITAMVVCLRPVAPPAAAPQQRRRLVLSKPSGKSQSTDASHVPHFPVK